MSGLLSLDDAGALEVSVVGAKAARLAEARQRGFPVLPGLVVPAAASRDAVLAGVRTLEARGPGAARVAVATVAIDPSLVSELRRVSELGPMLVLRSSTGLDDHGSWSGAFSSFADIGPDEVTMSIRSCWASLFTPDALARFGQTGARPDSAGMAVLIQPQVAPSVGGWTRVAGGFVEVAATAGAPGPLLSGWERGSRHLVGPDDAVDERRAAGPLGDRGAASLLDEATLRDLAVVARRAADELGADRLEWAVVDGAVVILQVDRAAPPRPAAVESPPIPETFGARPFRQLARLLAGRSGRLADRLIVPWGAAAADDVRPARLAGSPAVLFDDAKRLADDLGASVARSAGLAPEALIDLLDTADPLAIGRLAGVTVDPRAAAQILGAIESVGMALAERGLLDSPEEVWWQSVDWIETALSSDAPRPAARWLGGRWDHLVYGATVRRGEPLAGIPASDGRAAGRATRVADPEAAAAFQARDVLVLERPLPTFAPLLWRAAALVSATGSPAAHLFEVARSLRVPAAIVPELPPLGATTVVAVDGSSGSVWLWDPDAA